MRCISYASQQHIGTIFDFADFNETELNAEMRCSACAAELTENREINTNRLNKVLSIAPRINGEASILKNIYKSVVLLSGRFL